MKDFTATLADFRTGRCEFADVETAFSGVLKSSPALVQAALAELEQDYRVGRLPHQLYQALKGRAATTAAEGNPEATRLAARAPLEPADDGRTRLRPKPAATPSAPSTPTTGSRDAYWSGAADAPDAPDVAPGFVLKGRFVLEQEVGRGGMGVVFRARDLRKEEAQDRDPYVAIKILNDEFRRHPESLKALQREARKAQTLAHPNIATVFDFDRDGAIVYIQMEFLQGRPLDAVVRDSSGLPYRDAYPLIEGIGRALGHAHGAGIVHSDLKPGNCFVIGNGVVKVFDFGIARAAKISDAQRDELTKFDAGTLGALTPAYASCEMLDGMEPDPRDDIYALGCVAYELLTGKHPFGKLSATEARAAKLAPPAIKGLAPRQQRALQRSLAFRREDRTPTVAAFLEDLRERKRNKGLVAAGVAAAAAVAFVGFNLLQSYLAERRVDALVADLSSGVAERVEPALAEYRTLPSTSQTTVLVTARDPLLTYFTGRAAAAFDAEEGRYDFPAAVAVLDTALELIPDSATLTGLKTSMTEQQGSLRLEQIRLFDDHVAAGRLLPVAGADATDVLAVLQQASPADVPGKETSLVLASTRLATEALDANDVARARELIEFLSARAPDDTSLPELRDRLTAAVDATRADATAAAPAAAAAPASEATLRQTLAALLAAPAYDANWETRARDVLASLESTLPTSDTTVVDARARIAELYVTRAATMRGSDRLSEAQRLLGVAAGFAPELATLATERAALDDARARAAAANAERERLARIEAQRQTFVAATTANNRAEAQNALAELRRMLPPDDQFLTTNVPAALAGMAERLATAAMAAARLDEAEQLALEGLEAAPSTPTLQALLAEIRGARARAATPAGQPCTPAIAGFGNRGARGQCWDMIDAEQQGPRLVVVPAGNGLATPFAIARFEMALLQWNAYCRATEACTPVAGADTDPLANVTVSQARAYATWLSERTGARYRLPTSAEWQHAVAAPRAARNDDNCVVPAAGRGGTARDVTLGQQNEWGLLNYQGNVQEWTDVGGGAVEARGGSYRDPLESCVVTRARPHDGAADALTGFRLVRELTAP
jgi:non-specific serine/threonine protein kinase